MSTHKKGLVCFILFQCFKAYAWDVPFKPEAALSETPDSMATIDMCLWLLKSSVVGVTIWLLVAGSKNLSEENYYQASYSLLGALIVGGATYYAVPLVN